jgi:hypothetical protein
LGSRSAGPVNYRPFLFALTLQGLLQKFSHYSQQPMKYTGNILIFILQHNAG